jgi:hypothetical protein
MRHVFLIAVMALSACAAAGKMTSAADTRDCAVIEAVLKQHYQIKADTPYRLDRGDGPKAKDEKTFRIACAFPDIPIKDFDHNRPSAPPPNFQSWIKFPTRPTYPNASTAVVEAGSLLGPLAGSGVKCTLNRAGNAWRVQKCDMTWIS